VYIVETVFILI